MMVPIRFDCKFQFGNKTRFESAILRTGHPVFVFANINV